jgi:hypothetical protein
VETRQRAYLDLLARGVVAVRNYAYSGQMALCEVEADHIHNIPSLLEETNELRHRFYIVQERGLYLDRLNPLGAMEYLEFMRIWYAQPWKMLASIAGVELTE